MASANGGIIGPNNDPTGVSIPAKSTNAVTPYTGDGYWRAAPDTSAVCLLVVGGGGGGGGAGGGFRNLTSVTYPTAGVPITVGAGGPPSPPARDGGNSEFGGTTPYLSTGGGSYRNPGGSGGSGFRNNGQPVPSVAAPCGNTPCGLGNAGGFSPPEGNSGGITVCSQAGGGAGGAGGRGVDMPGEGASGMAGGPGSASSITGSPVTYSGGGGAGGNPAANWYPDFGNPWGRGPAPPSPGGGGGSSGAAGTDGLGGGAGAGPGTATGGSGVVIVKENNPTPQPASTFVTTASGVWSLQSQFSLKKADQWTS